MSHLPLGEYFVDINTHGALQSSFLSLSELADHVFALTEQFATPDTSTLFLGIKNRFASVQYPIGNTDVAPTPIRAILYQSMPAVQVQQVVVDFQTLTAEYEGQPPLSIETVYIEHARDELRSYLQAMWKRDRLTEKGHRMRESNEWKDFLRRLRHHGLLPVEPTPGSDTYVRHLCPICDMQTVVCITCFAVMCTNRACQASELKPFQVCSHHTSTTSCLDCLEQDHEKEEPTLGQCPECQLWFCEFELTWCLGRPKDAEGRTPSNWHGRIPAGNREHPIRVIRCRLCTGPQEQRRCANPRCWSRRARCVGTCELCAPDGGMWCSCEQYWACDDCKTSSKDVFKECPRCRGVYCIYECDYIRYCNECDRTTLCNDCVEEDWSTFAGGADVAEGAVLSGCHTRTCTRQICQACTQGSRCVGCHKLFCASCSRSFPRHGNIGRFCVACQVEKKG